MPLRLLIFQHCNEVKKRTAGQGKTYGSKNTQKMSVVYNTDEKKVNIQAFLNFMQECTPWLPSWHKNPDGNFTLVDSSKEPSKTEKLIPSRFYYNQECLRKKRFKHEIYNSLKFAREALEHRNLYASELKTALRRSFRSVMMLQIMDGKGRAKWFESYTKGTKRYNKIQKGKILDFVEARKQEGKDCFFLTLTCDVKKYASRPDAWLNYLDKEVRPVIENLRKHYDAEYVGTLESTLNGYPHIHMMLFFPHNKFPEFKHYHNQQKIRKGRLFDMIKKKVNSEVFDLEAAKGKNLKWYLVKYIGKGVDEDIFSLLDKKEPWNESDLKRVQEFVYLKMFHRRKLLMTRKGCKKAKIVQKKEGSFEDKEIESLVQSVAPEASASVVKKCTKEEIKDRVCLLKKRIDEMPADHATKLRGYLTSICTNSPSWGDISVEKMGFLDFPEWFDRVPERNNDVSKKDMQRFHCHSSLLFNSRNFLEDFMKFVINPEDSAINRKQWVVRGAGICTRVLDNYDLSDDKDFLKAVFGEFCFYVEYILFGHFSYCDVLELPVLPSNKRKNKLHGLRERLELKRTNPAEYTRRYGFPAT